MSRFGSQIFEDKKNKGASMGSDPIETAREFKEMVKSLHNAGIEVILDVVYNHTAEGKFIALVLFLIILEISQNIQYFR